MPVLFAFSGLKRLNILAIKFTWRHIDDNTIIYAGSLKFMEENVITN